jgi:pimeloyl-ACP methyl ester carboxylesterase
MATHARSGKPPRTLYTLLEARGLLEMAMLPAWLPLLQATPRGDGHTVLLVPGFTAGDSTLIGLRTFLQSRGYKVETWGLGQNTGFKLKFSQALEQKVRYLHHRTERKVSIVGWSLGGVYGYFAAHSAPECVRTVISLGSPMRFSVERLQVPLVVSALYRYFAHPMGAVAHLSNVRAKVLRSPPPMPSTCVYSSTDGVVPADSAQLDDSVGQHENIWVPGSHLGLGFNPAVMWVLADRLSQPEDDWQRFRPEGMLGSIYDRIADYMRTEIVPAA